MAFDVASQLFTVHGFYIGICHPFHHSLSATDGDNKYSLSTNRSSMQAEGFCAPINTSRYEDCVF
jgi:hypothetical protein